MEKKINLFLVILYILIGFLPNFGAVDRVATQWVYLNIISLLSGLFFLKYSCYDLPAYVFKNKPLLLFLIFVLWALLSITYSINVNESIISVIRLLSIFIAGLMLGVHLFKIENLKYLFVWVILPILIIETLFPFYTLIQIINAIGNYSFQYANDLETFTPNKNITAAILSGHLGFVFIIKYYLKKWEILLLLLVSLSASMVFFISARASIIGIIMSLVLILFLTLIKAKENTRYVVKVITFVFIGFLISTLVVGSSSNLSLQKRLTSINTEDTSTNERLRYYKHGLDHIVSNPLIGIGIGNWKLKSIEYDKSNIKNYIVPYHLHNDFLQYGAEMGILATLLYLLIFLWILIINIKRMDKNYFLSTSLIFAISILFFDSNFNFPHHRPIMMVFFIFIISLTELNRRTQIEK